MKTSVEQPAATRMIARSEMSGAMADMRRRLNRSEAAGGP